jgi:hypothetical protein
MHKSIPAAIAVAAAMSFAHVASAAVTYQFTATAPFDTGAISAEADSEFGTVLTDYFSVTLSGPVLGNPPEIPLSDLSSCGVTATVPIHCLGPILYGTFYTPYTMVEFGAGNPDGDSLGLFYYFAGNAFTTNGVHETILGAGFPQGQLTVSGVPEPATWAMLTLGLAMIGCAARRRRRGLTLAA